MRRKGRNIIVIGTSAGGLEALDQIIGQLPSDLPASILIVQHMAPEDTGAALLHRLGRHKAFNCKLAEDGEVFEPGRIYIAPPDYHLLVKKNRLLVTKGARENRYRPAVDPLFRSAAVTHGPRVIGVVLTGMLDDGTAGLIAIKKCGGVTVVQDPEDAAYPDMPQSAVRNLQVDHCLPVGAMGRLLEKLTRGHAGRATAIPEDVHTEATIAERVLSDVAQVNGLGSQVPYNCPNCGGVLWEVEHPDVQRYRCHTGHSFTAAALLTSQSERIEETLWISLRMFEERKNLLNNMADKETHSNTKRSYAERAKETEIHIERIRAMLLAPESGSRHSKPREYTAADRLERRTSARRLRS
jgi:two-component system chemotaxis response regulator CheB